VWTPGNLPISLFLDTSVSIGDAVLPAGAYRLYILPEKKIWTLLVNKSVKGAEQSDKTKEMVRVVMGSGDLGHEEPAPKVAFAQVAPTQCNIRVYDGSTMAWAETREGVK